MRSIRRRSRTSTENTIVAPAKPLDIDPELSMRVRALSGACRQLGRNWNANSVQALYDESEHLADRAQSAGIIDLSEALLGLAAYLSSFVDSTLVPGDTQLAQLRALADAAGDAHDRYRAHIEVATLGPSVNEAPVTQPTVHYLGRNMAHLELLRARCALLGYVVFSSDNVRDIDKAMAAGAVLVLVISADMLASWLTEHQVEASGSAATRVPITVLSDNDLLDVRLAAMRSNAEIVFVLPEDEERIAPRLSGLIADRSEPYRVLIVDDDNSMRLFCASVLRHNNLDTRAFATPEEAIQALHSFTPDVILADLYMPQISGFELLALFRAHPRTAFTPVVLLSGDSDTEKRFAALHIGGDDYLTKPIRPRHLVAAVTGRARRARWMRRELLATR
jgi:CheY-like chemotaxis protein